MSMRLELAELFPDEELRKERIRLQEHWHRTGHYGDRTIADEPLDGAAEGLPHRAKGEIAIRDLSFSHGAKEILHGINLTIRQGETVAFLVPPARAKPLS